MNTNDLENIGLFVTGVVGGIWTLVKLLVVTIRHGDEAVKVELKERISDAEAKLAATLGKSDLAFIQFKETAERDFLRKAEYDISQKNTDRRLESIESKVDKIPDSLNKQTELLVAVLKETRS